MKFRKKATSVYRYPQHLARLGERTEPRSFGRPRGLRDRSVAFSGARDLALLESPTYGIVLCNLVGDFLNVSDPVVTMLGYELKDELLELSLARDVFRDPRKCGQLLKRYVHSGRVEPCEVERKRKDGSSLPVRLRVVEARDARDALKGCEIIVEDPRELRTLNKQASAGGVDALTGLGNHRRFLDVLEAEIGWSERSAEPFALLLFHILKGSRARQRGSATVEKRLARRVADVLKLYCRSIDTAVRYDDDDFALVLPETGARAAALAARRIQDCLAYACRDGQTSSLEVDGGIYPDDAEMVENLIEAFRDPRHSQPHRTAV